MARVSKSSQSVDKILIVEDDDDCRVAFTELLQLWGYKVEAAKTGVQALEIALKAPPVAALIDIGLPDINGCEVARKLRELGDKCPVLIAFSAGALPEDKDRGFAAGFEAYLVKPVDLDELASIFTARIPVNPPKSTLPPGPITMPQLVRTQRTR